MSFPVTTSLKVIKPLQYVEEVTRGTTPTSPTFINAGPIQEFTPNTETNAVNYRMLGSPDLYKVIKTGERFSFDITYNPIDLDLVSYGVNLSGTKNRDKTLTFLLSQSMYPGTGTSLTEHYIKAVGCSCDSTSIDISLEAVSVSQTWIANDIPIPTITPGIGYSSLCICYYCKSLDWYICRYQDINI